MAPVIHACVEDTEILAMECAVPDVYQGHVIDIVEPVLMDVDQIGRESIVKVCRRCLLKDKNNLKHSLIFNTKKSHIVYYWLLNTVYAKNNI